MPQLEVNGVALDYEVQGTSNSAPLLLIMGLGMPAAAWPPALIERLVAAGLRVVTFDNRDSGGSSRCGGARTIGAGSAILRSLLRRPVPAPYRLEDMAEDAAALLDALRLERAHLVGISMGGMIAQLLAANRPQRIVSLTSIMSNTGNPSPRVAWGRPSALRAILSPPAPAADLEAVVDRLDHIYGVIGSPELRGDRTATRMHFRRIAQRGLDSAAAWRQLLAVMATGDRRDRLALIKAPTLVLHGARDPLVPVAAGRETARQIRNARLVEIESMGHDLPDVVVPRIAAEIIAHVRDCELPAVQPRSAT